MSTFTLKPGRVLHIHCFRNWDNIFNPCPARPSLHRRNDVKCRISKGQANTSANYHWDSFNVTTDWIWERDLWLLLLGNKKPKTKTGTETKWRICQQSEILSPPKWPNFLFLIFHKIIYLTFNIIYSHGKRKWPFWWCLRELYGRQPTNQVLLCQNGGGETVVEYMIWDERASF